jgi:hypothetical protein
MSFLGAEIEVDEHHINLGASCTFCVNANLDYLDVATARKRAAVDRHYSAGHHFLCHCQVILP